MTHVPVDNTMIAAMMLRLGYLNGERGAGGLRAAEWVRTWWRSARGNLAHLPSSPCTDGTPCRLAHWRRESRGSCRDGPWILNAVFMKGLNERIE